LNRRPAPDGYVGVTAEIEIDLEGEGQGGEPGLEEGQNRRIVKAPRGPDTQVVGQDHFLEKTHGDQEHPPGEIFRVEPGPCRVEKLRHYFPLERNGALAHLREEGHEKGVGKKFILSQLPPVGIDQERHLQKGTVADPQGGRNLHEINAGPEGHVKVLDEKIAVLEVAEEADVEAYARGHDDLFRHLQENTRGI